MYDDVYGAVLQVRDSVYSHDWTLPYPRRVNMTWS